MFMFPRIAILLIVLIVSTTACPAQEIFSGFEGTQLRKKIRETYRPTQTLSYLAARQLLFSSLDNQGGKVKCVYTGEELQTTSIPSSDIMNTEHTWPQSHFGSGRLVRAMKTDLHHLFPTISEVNSARGNKPFGEIDDSETTSWWISEDAEDDIPASGIDQYSESTSRLFETREDHKGNAARAMIYFFCMYENEGVNAQWFQPQINTLLAWNDLDPPDDKELIRNNAIRNAQGNLNPFVTDRTLATRAFAATRSALVSGEDVARAENREATASRLGHGLPQSFRDEVGSLKDENSRLREIVIRLELELQRLQKAN